MTSTSFEAHWISIRERQDLALIERQARHAFDLANDWSVNPGGMATSAWQQYLRLRLWGVSEETEFVRYCLNVAVRDAGEALLRNAFEVVMPAGSFPLNRYRFFESKIFIDALASGGSFSRETALQIAADQMALAPGYGRRQWDGNPQSQFLHAVDMLLLVDEYESAAAMLKEARGLNGLHVKEVAEVTKLIAKSPMTVGGDEQVRAQYRRMFDLLRDPNYTDASRGHPAFHPQLLVMACIWQKYFDPGQGAYSIDRAFALLRE